MIKKHILQLLFLVIGFQTYSQPNRLFEQQEVIYGRKDGMALTLFVNTPQKPNGKAIIYAASGGYFSNVNWLGDITNKMCTEYFKRGYTVFVVFHGSAPNYAGTDIISDMRKAVQFIRYNAKKYNIDPDHIGMTGTSAGANLACIMGTSDFKSSDPKANPQDLVSSKVQAVACFFPPTDFLNYGAENAIASDQDNLLKANGLKSAFMFKEYVPESNTLQLITDRSKILEILKQMSPAQLADQNAAPTLIYHGDADRLVPFQQATSYVEKLQRLKLPVKLIVKPNAGHGWDGMETDAKELANWFDQYLK